MLVLPFYLKMSYSRCISNVSSLPTTLQKDQTLKKRPQKIIDLCLMLDTTWISSIHILTANTCTITTETQLLNSIFAKEIQFNTSNECYVAYSASQAPLPRKTAIVTNCHIRAFSSKMTWSLAVLAEIVLAGSKNRIQVLIFI